MLTGPLIFLGLSVGEQTGREPICRGRRPSDFFPSEVHLVSHGAIHPSQESYRSVALQTGHESWPLLSLSIVKRIFDWGTLARDSVSANVTEACSCDCICI